MMTVTFNLGFFFLLICIAVSRELSYTYIDLLFEPEQKSYAEGEEVTMTCGDGTYSGNCEWLQDDQSIDLETIQGIKTNKNNSCVITISHLTVDDASWWTCQHFQEISATKRLAIESKKIVQLIPNEAKVMHVEEGTAADLQCLFNHSAPYCFWTKDDNVLVIRGRYRFIGNKNEGNCSIRVSRVTHKDYGKWRCGYPMTDNEPAVKSFAITLNITVIPTAPFITLNNVNIEKEKPLFLVTQTDAQQVYRNNQYYHDRVLRQPTGNVIACWILNGYPEAQLKWTIEDENGEELNYLDQAHKARTWNVISTSSNLKSSYLDLKLKTSVYEFGIRRVKLVCSANHPSFKNITKTAFVWLIWGHQM